MTIPGPDITVAVVSTSPALAAAYAAGLVAFGISGARTADSSQVHTLRHVVLIADEYGHVPDLPADTRADTAMLVVAGSAAATVRARLDRSRSLARAATVVDAEQPLQRQFQTLARALRGPGAQLPTSGDSTRRADELRRMATLTVRERQVLAALMAGSSATEVASGLVLSIATIRAHIRSILVKLGVSSQLAAAALACRVQCRPGARCCESSQF